MKNSVLWKVFKLTFLLFAITLIVPPKNSIVSQSEDDIDALVNKILENMTPEEKIGQLFMVYWSETNELPEGLLELIDTYKVGSVLISEVNFLNGKDSSTVNRVANLANNLQQYNWENNQISVDNDLFFVPLFLAVDHEGDGARLTRIRDGMTPIPSQMSIGATWSTDNAETVGQIVGSELNALGINMLLGPVVDVLDDVDNGEGRGNLDIRVFGGDPEWVGELGRAYIRGVHIGSQGQVLTVAKHFPGHGDSNRATDDLVARPGKDYSQLQQVDLIPFIRVTEYDEEDLLGIADALMSSHIAIKETEPDPISLYYDISSQEGGVEQLINSIEVIKEWNKNGFVVVDSLGVGAIRNTYGENYNPVTVADLAFRAGNDLLILHSITPNDGVSRTPDELQEEAFHQIKGVVSFFNENYYDPFYQNRIDEAVRKIIRAKLMLYPTKSIESVLVDLSEIESVVGTPENYAKVAEIASQSTALIYPQSEEEIIDRPSHNDDIVFVIHNFDVPSCASCGSEWKENILEKGIDFLVTNRNFSGNISTLYYYQEDGSPGLSTVMYGSQKLSDLGYSFPIPQQFPVSDREYLRVYNLLKNADWIVFLFAAGDCGPNARNEVNRCSIGMPESDTLDKFYYYRQYYGLDAKIAALSFGAPPWGMDSGHVSILDLYYGVFSQIEPFHQQAMRVLIGDAPANGHSPVNVEAINYNIQDQLAPNPNQTFEISIPEITSPNTWYVGDTINLEINQLVDFLGNPILDTIPIMWEGKYPDGVLIEPDNIIPWSYNRKGAASFILEQPGELEITAEIENISTASYRINVLSTVEPTTPPIAPTKIAAENTPFFPTDTPEVLTPASPTDTPNPQTTIITPPPTSEPTVWNKIGDSLVTNFVELLGVILTFIIGFLTYQNAKRKKSDDQEKSITNNINNPSSGKLSDNKQAELHEKLDKGFSENELKTLCLKLNIDFDNLAASGKSNKARELVIKMGRLGRLDELEEAIKKDRPHLFKTDSEHKK